jgi:hypothetical protein
MSFFDKARQAAEQARQAASVSARQASEQIKQSAPGWQEQTKQGLNTAGVGLKEGAGKARKGIITVVERIDPGILADIVIKATALQEKANASLRAKGSPYRIAEITITATIPPQIGFSIARLGDAEEALTGQEVTSMQLVDAEEATPEGSVLTLDGELHDADELAAQSAPLDPGMVEAQAVVTETVTTEILVGGVSVDGTGDAHGGTGEAHGASADVAETTNGDRPATG